MGRWLNRNKNTEMNIANTRSGRNPLRVTLWYPDGTKVCHNDVAAKARLFDALLESLDVQGLRQLEQAIAELRLRRADRDAARRILEEKAAADVQKAIRDRDEGDGALVAPTDP